jgi:electron transfer flavoprotein beta subunit
MGADEALLVKDDTPETYDGLRTARIIARAVERKLGGADLLLFGKQSVGADNSQVPAMVAEFLGLPQATVVTKLEIEGASATALREIEGGLEKVVFSLPAVVSAQKGLNEPRYETLKGIMAAKKKPVPVVTLDELGLEPGDLVSAVETTGLDVPAARQAGKLLRGDPAETARELVRLLRDEAKVI